MGVKWRLKEISGNPFLAPLPRERGWGEADRKEERDQG